MLYIYIYSDEDQYAYESTVCFTPPTKQILRMANGLQTLQNKMKEAEIETTVNA